MLFTRCPDCETTFRVTDETLKKANGQVRCGRCASVFNAYAELQDPAAKSFEPSAPHPPAARTPPAHEAAPAPAVDAAQTTETAPATTPAPPQHAAASIGTSPAAVVVAEVALAEKERGAGDVELISAEQIDEVLTTRVPPTENAPQSWSAFGTEPRRRSSRWWSAAAALGLLALGAQTVHYFRADVASHPTFGSWIQQAYGWVGVDLKPHWDVRQYEILDWVATAEPNARGLGSLKIAARIQNHGPLRQPYPAVQLRLKDRWEKAVSSRLFTPAEYLPRDAPRERLMSAGETARAQFEVVDPGPDAYGFELDVCVEVEASLVTCGADKVFL